MGKGNKLAPAEQEKSTQDDCVVRLARLDRIWVQKCSELAIRMPQASIGRPFAIVRRASEAYVGPTLHLSRPH